MHQRPASLALVSLLSLASVCALVQTAPEPTTQGTRPPAKKAAPAFTDDDLARYREERLRREAEPAPPPTAGIPGPAIAPPTPAAARGSVELLDLNRKLPPEARTAAEAAARRFVTFFGVPVDGTPVVPLRYFPDAVAIGDSSPSGCGRHDSRTFASSSPSTAGCGETRSSRAASASAPSPGASWTS